MTLRIAMWSGPRTVSTALMRSFAARSDTVVVDEPLYSYYLTETGLDHPGREQVIASQPVRWQDAAAGLALAVPAAVQYQKHMAHHLLPGVGRGWLGVLAHAFLIRDPARVVASYAKVRGSPTLDDLGYPQQVEIFRAHGGPVLDSADLVRNPRVVLARLCAELGIGFDPAMLSWPAGPRDTDGVWARHWYAAVESSTGFAASVNRGDEVPAHLRGLVVSAQPYYDELAAHRISAD